jgi:transposase-like protein
LDEVFIRIQGVQHYLWRAVDQHGVVLVQERRDGKAAKRFFRRLLNGLQYVPRVIVTDKLRSYGVAQRQILPGVEHRQSQDLNNRAENRIVRLDVADARCNGSSRRMAEGCLPTKTKLRSSKYLNNVIEQDHRGVNQRVAVIIGFRQFRNAAITITGNELMRLIRKEQFGLRRLGVQGETAPAIWNAILGA